MKTYNLSVTDFAQPTPRVGSIDTYSGFQLTSKLAMKAHQNYQLRQLKGNKGYTPEVPIAHQLTFKDTGFKLSGRMDGVYQDERVRIEEIKTAFEPQKLIDTLADNYFTHPYWLQLQVYGYIHWLKTQSVPHLNLLILSLRNKKTFPLALNFNRDAFETWLNRRLEALVGEIEDSNNRSERRKQYSGQLQFPFAAPRPQQQELMETIEASMKRKQPLLIQAPTGLGKTSAVLYPALKEALSRGQKLIYVTPKNSQHQVALHAVQLLQAKGASCTSLVLTSKKKLCMKNEPVCTRKHCEFADHHYTKITTHHLLKIIQEQQNLDAQIFKELATTYRVCPYALQMESIADAEVVIGDYNYVFSAANTPSPLLTMKLGEHEKPNLVMDEAHNLPSRGMDYVSPSLAVAFFERYLESQKRYPKAFQKKLTKNIHQCINLIDRCAVPHARQPHRVEVPIESFRRQEEQLQQLLTDYLTLDGAIESDDPIMMLCNYWFDFTAALECAREGGDAFFVSFDPLAASLKISCCDASTLLEEHYRPFEHIIGFSATLKPFNYYRQLMGLKNYPVHTAEFSSPFLPQNRKLLIIPQVSTKYRDRHANQRKIIEVITRLSAVKPGNYFVFFPSFEFLEHIHAHMPCLPEFTLIRQERRMTAADTHALLTQLHQKNKPHLFFAVQGGLFAEGVDYVGELAIGAFIVDPPLPSFSWEREQRKRYYATHYQQGQEYAYTYPAMAKAIQSAGRVIRSETDKGLIVLMDNRFLHSAYSRCMPKEWFVDTPQELVSSALLKDVRAFWQSIDPLPSPSESAHRKVAHE